MQRMQRFALLSRKYSVLKVSKIATTNESQKCMELNTADILNASLTQPETSTVMNESLGRTESIPLLEPVGAKITPRIFDITKHKIEPQIIIDKAPLAFEDIPSPAISKIWEKSWKYVPLFGTQLICSLLINRFTQGRALWNRNFTPIKFLFDMYGCVMRINGPLVGDIVMIYRPEHIEEVFKQEGDMPIRSGIDILQYYRLKYRKYRLAGPFSTQGSEWLTLREKVDEEFNKVASRFFEKVDLVCDELISKIRSTRNRQDEVPTNFNQDLINWGLECFSTIIFNKHLGFLESPKFNASSETTKITSALITAHKYMSRCETGFQMWRLFETPFAKRLFSACDVLDGFIGKYIHESQNKLRKKSTSRSAEEALKENEGSSPVLEKFLLRERIHPDDICTMLMDMIILGVQAVANCEAFLLFFLAKNPRVQRKLYSEIVSVLPDRNSAFTEKTLKNMPYLKACLQESLRLRPAFPYITRLLPKAITLHGYTIPKGTSIIMANEITSQREEYFENADKFLPERWLSNYEQEVCYSQFSFIPFGHGMRSCLGKNIAETQMMLLTAKLVRQFRIEYDYADIKSEFMMVNVPKKPLRFRMVDRD